MSRSLSLFIFWLAALSATSAALAQTPPPGEYETHNGWGALSISAGKNGVALFQIDTIGANAHVCSLNGKIKGDTGYAEAGEADPQCFITFKAVPGGFSVSAQTPETCREYCGARAGFEGAYLLPPSGCKPDEREARRSFFTAMYRLENYAQAYESLNSFYKQCGDFLNWIEIDKVRNDLAIAQYHLGQNASCLSILKDTLGATQANEEELSASLPPSDFDSYLPVAQATWFNLKLCGKGGAATRLH